MWVAAKAPQIIQLFGRGVRLKGYEWSLKRSGHIHAATRPTFIDEMETLNVFGIEADFMEKFRDFLKEEGLPGNEQRQVFTVPLNVTYNFGKQLKMSAAQAKTDDGREYDFKQDGPVPTLGEVPDYLTQNPVRLRLVSAYPIDSVTGNGQSVEKEKAVISSGASLPTGLRCAVFRVGEVQARTQLVQSKHHEGQRCTQLLSDPTWYTLYLPQAG